MRHLGAITAAELSIPPYLQMFFFHNTCVSPTDLNQQLVGLSLTAKPEPYKVPPWRSQICLTGVSSRVSQRGVSSERLREVTGWAWLDTVLGSWICASEGRAIARDGSRSVPSRLPTVAGEVEEVSKTKQLRCCQKTKRNLKI